MTDKSKVTEVPTDYKGIAGTAGDGTNDVFVSVWVDAGPVTGVVGIDMVTEIVDAVTTDDDPCKTFVPTCSLC